MVRIDRHSQAHRVSVRRGWIGYLGRLGLRLDALVLVRTGPLLGVRDTRGILLLLGLCLMQVFARLLGGLFARTCRV